MVTAAQKRRISEAKDSVNKADRDLRRAKKEAVELGCRTMVVYKKQQPHTKSSRYTKITKGVTIRKGVVFHVDIRTNAEETFVHLKKAKMLKF